MARTKCTVRRSLAPRMQVTCKHPRQPRTVHAVINALNKHNTTDATRLLGEEGPAGVWHLLREACELPKAEQSLRTVRWLLDHGVAVRSTAPLYAGLDLKLSVGPLATAASHARVDLMQLLLQHGATANPDTWRTPLESCLSVTELVAKAATATHRFSGRQAAQLLLDHGADPCEAPLWVEKRATHSRRHAFQVLSLIAGALRGCISERGIHFMVLQYHLPVSLADYVWMRVSTAASKGTPVGCVCALPALSPPSPSSVSSSSSASSSSSSSSSSSTPSRRRVSSRLAGQRQAKRHKTWCIEVDV